MFLFANQAACKTEPQGLLLQPICEHSSFVDRPVCSGPDERLSAFTAHQSNAAVPPDDCEGCSVYLPATIKQASMTSALLKSFYPLT